MEAAYATDCWPRELLIVMSFPVVDDPARIAALTVEPSRELWEILIWLRKLFDRICNAFRCVVADPTNLSVQTHSMIESTTFHMSIAQYVPAELVLFVLAWHPDMKICSQVFSSNPCALLSCATHPTMLTLYAFVSQ